MNTSFLVRTDFKGLVQQTYWVYPISLLISGKSYLESLFTGEAKQDFSSLLAKAGTTRYEHRSIPCSIFNQPVDLSLLLFFTDSGLWVLGHELQQTEEEQEQLMVRMLDHFNRLNNEHVLGDTRMVYSHFEEIQKLNNELVNTQRELYKANKKLETLNVMLNNRLVKDPLTGLVSRYQYQSEMQLVIERNPQAFGVFAFIDIDDFKRINDSYGHAVGDQYLVEFSRRLASFSLPMHTIAMRIAGDEFGLYVHPLEAPDAAFFESFHAGFLAEVTNQTIETTAGNLTIQCSLGFAVYNRDTTNLFTLIEYADWAMYQAKQQGKHSYQVFDNAKYEESKPKTIS